MSRSIHSSPRGVGRAPALLELRLVHATPQFLGARRLACAVLALGALVGCGTSDDTATFQQVNCCVAGVYYVCSSAEAAGRCQSQPSDPSLCAKQAGPCP
jgi:hypothetical protein